MRTGLHLHSLFPGECRMTGIELNIHCFLEWLEVKVGDDTDFQGDEADSS